MSTPITTAIGRVQPLYRGEYNSYLNYEKLDNVLYNGRTYVALKSVPAGQVPGSASSSYWQLIAEKGDTGGFGTPTASASALSAGQTPTVKITSSGPNTAKIFDFEFGIPAGPTGPIGFHTISASASALSVGAEPSVSATRTEDGGNINLDFQFGIPAAEGQGAISVDNITLDQNRNVNLTAVRAVQNQGLSADQQRYARENIGAVSTSRTINGKNLASDITLGPADIGAVPTSRTINSKNLNSNITLTPEDIGAVPTGRTINSKALSSNITLTPEDIGAVPTGRTINSKALSSDITLAAADVGAVPINRTINSKALTSDIALTASDVGAISNTSGSVSSSNIAAEAVTTAKIANGAVSREKLAQDALYSPIITANANVTINASHCGKTLRASKGSDANIDITITYNTSNPVGMEFAVLNIWTKQTRIVAGTNVKLLLSDGSTPSSVVVPSYGMAAAKLIARNTSTPFDQWYITGNVEVAS